MESHQRRTTYTSWSLPPSHPSSLSSLTSLSLSLSLPLSIAKRSKRETFVTETYTHTRARFVQEYIKRAVLSLRLFVRSFVQVQRSILSRTTRLSAALCIRLETPKNTVLPSRKSAHTHYCTKEGLPNLTISIHCSKRFILCVENQFSVDT